MKNILLENLKKAPFHLSDDQVQFVVKKLSEMTLDEKIGQLFLPINYIDDEEKLRNFVQRFQPAGLMNQG
ncbi:MAG: hypothetical protein HFH35_14255 [Eubacterium sp.]|nr:hypothetical protein [Eubacterium sp.]